MTIRRENFRFQGRKKIKYPFDLQLSDNLISSVSALSATSRVNQLSLCCESARSTNGLHLLFATDFLSKQSL